jgi:hypothetical protein
MFHDFSNKELLIQHASYYLLKSFNDKGDAIGRIFVCSRVGQQQRIELSQQSSNSHLPTTVVKFWHKG